MPLLARMPRKLCRFCGAAFTIHPPVKTDDPVILALVATGKLHACATCATRLLSGEPLEVLAVLCRMPDSPAEDYRAQLDDLARSLTRLRPDLDALSLDDWMITHRDQLTTAEANAAFAIGALYD